MASVDLVFAGEPLHQPVALVFGDDGSSPVKDAVIAGDLAFPEVAFASVVHLGYAVSAPDLALPDVAFSSEIIYRSDTARPLVASVEVRWQDSVMQAERVRHHMQDGDKLPTSISARYQDAVSLRVGTAVRMQDAVRTPNVQRARFQDAKPIQRGAAVRMQNGIRRPNAQHTRFQDGAPVRRGVLQRFQDARRTPNTQHTRYQDATQLPGVVASRNTNGIPLQRGWSTRYQEALPPRPGRTNLHPVEPPKDPCYVPSADLVFEALWSADTNLVFYCEKHDGPGPEPGETVVVPIRRIYTVLNSATLRRVVGDVLIPTLSMSLTIDVDSWTWGFTARTPGQALADLEPGPSGEPVEVEATVNGVPYRAMIEGISRERVFGRSDLTVTGRGKAAVLDAPYTPVMSFGNATDRTAQQLANDVLTINGVPLGWGVDWSPEDWLVPAGVWSHQGSYITALNAIASAAGGYVQPHRTAKSLSVQLRYPAAPWDWADVTPDYELPAAVVKKEAVTWSDKALYNRVYVSGVQAGVLGQVTRAGTAGDIEAPMVTDPLMTTAVAARQRGLPVLADVGRQAAVSLQLPVLEETGIIPPGKFVRYVDGGVTRIGLVRSTSASIERADRKLTIWQTIGVETHVNV